LAKENQPRSRKSTGCQKVLEVFVILTWIFLPPLPLFSVLPKVPQAVLFAAVAQHFQPFNPNRKQRKPPLGRGNFLIDKKTPMHEIKVEKF
jgi:hypothetical protein